MEPVELSKKIEMDIGLSRSRKYLLFTSLIVLALTFSGAQVTEANTFLFKLTFSNPSGLKSLLLLSICFLLVRYHSHANKYQEEIYNEWTSKLLKHNFFYSCCEHSDHEMGYLVDVAPAYFGYNDDDFYHNNDWNRQAIYKANFLFNAQIQFDLFTHHGHTQDQRVYIFNFKHIRRSLKALGYIVKIWWDAQVRHHDSLDIYAPYIIGLVALFLNILEL